MEGVFDITAVEDVRYRGEVLGNVPHGHGAMEIRLRDRLPITYVGEWVNGRPTKGRKQVGELFYEGEFGPNGAMHGRGVFQGVSFRHEGEFVNNERHGQGETQFYYGERSRYVGEYANNKRHGFGTMTYMHGGSYEGEFANNKRHGEGILISSTGLFYSGWFVDGKKHGPGVEILLSGCKIELEYNNGKKVRVLRTTIPSLAQ